jgi:hypothetical protein
MDDEGFGTSTQPLTGGKYWVVFYQDPKMPMRETMGNLGSIRFPPDYDRYLAHDIGGFFTAEAVELRPGDLL